MEIGLTHGEVAVLAAHREVSPALIVGDRSSEEQERLLKAGWRSLLARRLARFEEGQARLDTGIVSFAEPAVRPRAVATYTRIVGENSILSTFFIGDEGALSAAPIADEVTMFSSLDMASIAQAIVTELELEPDEAGAFRMEVVSVDGRGSQALAWVHLPGASIEVIGDEGSAALSVDEFSTILEQFIESIEGMATSHGEVGS